MPPISRLINPPKIPNLLPGRHLRHILKLCNLLLFRCLCQWIAQITWYAFDPDWFEVFDGFAGLAYPFVGDGWQLQVLVWVGCVWFDILRLCKWKYPRQGLGGSYDGECGRGDGSEFHF